MVLLINNSGSASVFEGLAFRVGFLAFLPCRMKQKLGFLDNG